MSTVGMLVALARPTRWRLLGAAALGAAAIGCAVGLAAAAAWLIGRASQQPSMSVLAVAVVGVRAFGIGRGTLRYVERLVGHDAAFRVLRDVRVSVVASLERLAPAGLPAFRSGDLLARLVGDVDDIQEPYLRVWPPFATAALVGAGTAIGLAVLLPVGGLVVAVGMLLAATLVPWLAVHQARAAQEHTAAARGALSEVVLAGIRDNAELTALGLVDVHRERVRADDAGLTGLARRTAFGAGLGSAAMQLVVGLTIVVVLAAGADAVTSGGLSPVALCVLVLTPLAAFEAFLGLPLAASLMSRVRQSLRRVTEVTDASAPVAEPAAPAEVVPGRTHHIQVDDLGVRWPGSDRLALDGVTLDLPPGRRIAVVGASGSGKTTLAWALLRFVEASAGAVRLDGRDTREYASDDVRRVVGLCAQDAHVFDSTLEQNLRLARPDASPAELASAVRQARLDEWVATLPSGLDTLVGEHGARLSGGQRQRLALARALLADFPVLVLDEPTEHLSLDAADALMADLVAATEGRTTLLVTHRLRGLEAVDEVLVLDAGRVVERGSHAELLAAGGRYASAWADERSLDAV